MADLARRALSLLLRRIWWGILLPCIMLGLLCVVLLGGWRYLRPMAAHGAWFIEGRAWVCAALMLVGVFPMLAIVFLLETWLRPLLVPEAIPNLGRSSGCVLTAVVGGLLPLLAAAVPLGAFYAARWFHAPYPKPARLLEPVHVRSFQPGDIVYAQLDRNGSVTSISHFFRGIGTDDADPDGPFTVNRTDADHGHIVLYGLYNVLTGEAFEFPSVPVRRPSGGVWLITDEGQRQIREELEERMGVKLFRYER